MPVVAVCLSLLLLSGCLWAPDLEKVKNDIQAQAPGASFHRKIAFSLGPVTLGIARGVLKLVPDARDAEGYLRDIRNVQVAVYDVENLPNGFAPRTPNPLQKLLDRDRWELAVRTCEDGEAVWVLYKISSASFADFCVVALEGDELTLVRVRGRLEDIVKRAMRDNVYAARTR